MRVFTLGTGDRHPLDFSRILAKYGIESVFDIRRLPLHEEGFDRDALTRLCAAAGVGYVFLGNELGIEHNYRAWAASEPLGRWLGIIRRKLEQRAVCLLCREPSPERCRRRVIAEKLAADGVEVIHILDDVRQWRPAPGDPGLLAALERARAADRPGRPPRRGRKQGHGHRPR
ncbi:MAG: DUF488 domain-containing protein [bacterium]